MRKWFYIGCLLVFVFLLSACSNNKVDGTWVKYSEDTEKEKTIWEIDTKEEYLTEEIYEDGDRIDSFTTNIELNEDKDVLMVSMWHEEFESFPFTLEDDELKIADKIFYREGSEKEEEDKNKAKEARLAYEDQKEKEREEEEKLKKEETELNEAIETLETKLNEEFKETYAGIWYSGEGLDEDDSMYQSTSIKRINFENEDIIIDSSRISINDEEREVTENDSTYYTFEGLILPRKHEYTEQPENERTPIETIELPETKKEFEDIETLEDFATYQKSKNVRELRFEYQSNGGDTSDEYFILNVNDIEKLESTEGWGSGIVLEKELPQNIKDDDFREQ